VREREISSCAWQLRHIYRSQKLKSKPNTSSHNNLANNVAGFVLITSRALPAFGHNIQTYTYTHTHRRMLLVCLCNYLLCRKMCLLAKNKWQAMCFKGGFFAWRLWYLSQLPLTVSACVLDSICLCKCACKCMCLCFCMYTYMYIYE